LLSESPFDTDSDPEKALWFIRCIQTSDFDGSLSGPQDAVYIVTAMGFISHFRLNPIMVNFL